MFSRAALMVRFARRHGMARAAYRTLRGVIDAFGMSRVVSFSLVDIFTASSAGLASSPRLPRVFTVRRAVEEDLPALQAFFGKPQTVLDRVRRGDLCFILLGDGKICAAEWLAPGPNDYREDWDDLRCIFRVPRGVCWLYDGTGEQAGLGAWGMLMQGLTGQLRDLAINEAYLAIEYDNVKSIRSHEALGFHAVSQICHLRIAGLSISLYRSNAQAWRFLPGRVGLLELSGEANARG